MEVWKEFMRWKPDDMPESTDAIVIVSNKGRVKRLPYKKWCKTNNSYSLMKEKEYAYLTNRGKQKNEGFVEERFGKYIHVDIAGKCFSVHRMVGISFIPNPLNLPQINHIDENRSNNDVDNLEWVTNKQNQEKKSKELRKKVIDKLIRFSESDCLDALNMRIGGKSIIEIGKIYNVSHETVRLRTEEIATNEQILIIKNIQRKNGEKKRIETMRLRGIIK